MVQVQANDAASPSAAEMESSYEDIACQRRIAYPVYPVL